MTPFEIFLLSAFFIMLSLLIFEEVRLRKKNSALIENVVTLTLDKITLQKQISEIPMTPTETEGFIKFLSESREWAFTYIEDVQEAIEQLRAAMVEGNESKISEAYEKLTTFLPEKMNND